MILTVSLFRTHINYCFIVIKTHTHSHTQKSFTIDCYDKMATQNDIENRRNSLRSHVSDSTIGSNKRSLSARSERITKSLSKQSNVGGDDCSGQSLGDAHCEGKSGASPQKKYKYGKQQQQQQQQQQQLQNNIDPAAATDAAATTTKTSRVDSSSTNNASDVGGVNESGDGVGGRVDDSGGISTSKPTTKSSSSSSCSKEHLPGHVDRLPDFGSIVDGTSDDCLDSRKEAERSCATSNGANYERNADGGNGRVYNKRDHDHDDDNNQW